MNARCPYCETEYDVPPGMHGVTERTADMPPPAHVVVWALPLGEDRPDFAKGTPPILHECRRGHAISELRGEEP